MLTLKFQAERHKHLHFLPLVKTINLLFLFIIFNLYQNNESSRGGEYPYSDFKITRPYDQILEGFSPFLGQANSDFF